MKSYTDIEQSMVLSKMLPLESADMKWYYWKEEIDAPKIPTFGYSKDATESYKSTEAIYLPCWSLAALLCVLPKPDLVQNSEGTWLIHSWVNAYPWSVGGYSNPVDACYEMILKLHELNLL